MRCYPLAPFALELLRTLCVFQPISEKYAKSGDYQFDSALGLFPHLNSLRSSSSSPSFASNPIQLCEVRSFSNCWLKTVFFTFVFFQALKASLPPESKEMLSSVDIRPPGFINVRLQPLFVAKQLASIIAEGFYLCPSHVMCLLLLNTFHSFLSLPHDRSETPSF
jgi:hypothetical protein